MRNKEQVMQAGKFHGQETDAIVQQEVTRNPKLSSNGLEVDDEEERRGKSDVNTMHASQCMKMTPHSFLTTAIPTDQNKNKRTPLSKIISFVCMQIGQA